MRIAKTVFLSVICLCVSVMGVASVKTGAEANQSQDDQRDEMIRAFEELDMERITEYQHNAVMANEALMAAFHRDGGGYDYPETYAGDYIEYDKLVVLLTDMDAVSEYDEILSDYTDVVEYALADRSYQSLKDDAMRYGCELKEKYDVVSFGPDVKTNSVSVSVLESDYEKIGQNENLPDHVEVTRSSIPDFGI